MALDEWQEKIRKWASMSGDRFNVSMKNVHFVDKAPSSERVSLQMQNLDTFEAMAAVTLQFLQQNAQYRAGVTVTPRVYRRGPDDMEIDAMTKKGKGEGGAKHNRRAEHELLRVRMCWSHRQRLLVKRNEQGQWAQQQRQERPRQREEQCERSHDSDGVSDDPTIGNLSQPNFENHWGHRHLGDEDEH